MQFVDFAGLQYYDQKLQERLAPVTHSYTTTPGAAKNWYRLANATTSQIDVGKPLHVQFILTAWNENVNKDYYERWFVDCEVFGRQSGIRVFGNSAVPFQYIRVLYENTDADVDSTDKPAIDIYLNYVINSDTTIKIEEVNNSGFEFVANGQLAVSTVPTGFESRQVGVYGSGVSNAGNADYATYAGLQRSNFTANFTLADNNTYRMRTLNCTGTITVTAPSINSTWSWFWIKNANATSGVVTIHPSSSSVLIDGKSEDIALQPGESILLQSKAANNYTVLADTRWWSKKADKATTIAGYGITDAKIASGTITLGSNSITPLTSASSLDASKLTGTLSLNTSGKATTAGTADKVANKLTLKLKSGSTEGTDLYTYDGSGAKTLDIKQGSNVTLTAASGSLTIASKDTVYTHPTTSGNKHIPSGGSSGQFLGWDSDGTAKWVANPNTNTDTLMTQNVSTTNATYPILAVATANANANQGAKTGIFGAGVKLNPSTSTISATRFDGAISIYKADALNTDNASNDIPIGMRGLSRQARSCKTAFTPAANITIEYTTDGSTWTDYGATDAQKQELFAMKHSGSFALGKGTAGGTSAVTTNCKLRVTIEPADRYATVDTLYLWLCAFNHTMKVDIETSTIGAKTTFTAMRTGIPVSGWSGANLISFTRTQYGGGSNQTGNRYAYRFTFYCTAIGANTTSYPTVSDIRLYGPFSHTVANNMMGIDSLYTWDISQNATFPAQVTATKFNGPSTKVETTVANDATGELVRASIGTNDYFRIAAGGASNAGWAEIATADDYNEPIYVRQYQGNFATLKRTATLLDGSGNTSFPGIVTAAAFSGPLTGDVTGNCSGTASNVTGTVAIGNGGTGATTRENACKALFNANIGSSPTHFLTGTSSFANSGYTSIADAKTALGINATDSNPTLAWGTKSKVATVNGVAINVTMPANPNTDTKNTAGSTDSSKKLFLIGAESQTASSQTYSHDTAYVGTDGCLYSGGTKVLTAHQTLPTLSYSETGSGNAITSLSVSNHAITATKGTTFLTSHQSLSNYVTLNGAQTISGAKTFTAKPVLNQVGLDMTVKDTTEGSTTTRTSQVLHANSSNSQYGINIAFCSGGNTVVGGGEAGTAQLNALAGNSGEDLYLVADGNIYLKPNGNTWANAKTITLNTSGELSGLAKVTSTSFVGTLTGNVTGNCSGTAAKLATARSIGLGLDFTGSANFDGSGNITINASPYNAIVTIGNKNNYPYHHIATYGPIASTYIDAAIRLHVARQFINGGAGIVEIEFRTNGTNANGQCAARWIARSSQLPVDCIQVGFYKTWGGIYADVFYKSSGTYASCVIRSMGDGSRAAIGRSFTLQNSQEVSDTTASDPKTSTNSYATIAAAGTALHNQAYTDTITASDGGIASNVSGTVAIANGGTGATTRENACKALFNANIGSSPTHFLTGTSSFANSGYTSIADAKTVLGLKSAAYTESSAYAAASHGTHVTYATSGTPANIGTASNGSAATVARSDHVHALPDSGVTAQTWGNTSQQTPSHGGTFNIPYFTVSAKGIVTAAGTTTVKLPADNNTWTAMTGATSSANGTVGYINAAPPKDGYNTKFWRADGTWNLPNCLYTSSTPLGNGLIYTTGQPAIGTSAGQLYKGSSNNAALISAPENGTYYSSTNGNVQNLRLSWSTDGKYLTDIFASPNNDFLWHRNVVNTTAKPWRRLVEENATGITAPTWDISIGGNAATVTGTAGTSALSWNTETTVYTVGGHEIKVKLPANPNTNTDTLMTQNVSTTNATYPILAVATADATANQGAKTGIFGAGIKINPSTSTIAAKGITGTPSGTTFVAALTEGKALASVSSTGYSGVWNAPTKNYRVGASVYPSSNDDVYVTYSVTNANIAAGTNTVAKKLVWNAGSGALTADSFYGNGQNITLGTASKMVVTDANKKLAAASATTGSASTPVYLNAGAITAVDSALKSCYAVVESEAVTNNIFKIASGSMGGAYNGLNLVILIQNIMGSNAATWRIHLNASSTAGVYSGGGSVLVDNIGLDPANFIVAYKSNSGGNLDFELYTKIAARYAGYRFTVIQEVWRSNQKLGNILTLYNQLTSTGTAAITSGYTALTTTKATVGMDISGNAASATKATQDSDGNAINTTYLKLSGGTVSGTLILSRNTDASGTANNKPALIIGGADTAAHIEIDPNEIMAKGSGTTTAPLYLNTDGGIVYIGGNTDNYKAVTGRGKGSSTLPVYTNADGIVTACGTSLDVSISGTAAKATGDTDGNAIKTTYAKLASPALTGTPTAPTAAAGTNTTQIATTAFVYNNAAKHIAANTSIYVAKAATGNGSGSNTSNYMSLADLRTYLATVHMHSSTADLNSSYTLTILFKAGDSFGNATFDASKIPGIRNIVLNTSTGTNSTTSNYSTNSPTFGNITVTGNLAVTMRNLNCTGRISAQYGSYVALDTYIGASSFSATNHGYLNIAKNMVLDICDAHTDYLFNSSTCGFIAMWPGATITINFRQQCYYSRALFLATANGTLWLGYSSLKFTGTQPIAVWSGSGTLTGTSETAAATAEKAVTLASGQTFTLANNATAKIKFTIDNTAANPTLNINSTGAKPIYWNNAAVAANMIIKNFIYDVKYNGTQYVIQNVVKRLTNNDFGIFRTSGNYNQTYNSGEWNFTGWSLYYGTGVENSNWRGNVIGNIQQNVTTSNNTYPILFTGTANATANTSTYPYFGSGVKINPSTSNVYATQFNGTHSGNLTGTANIEFTGVATNANHGGYIDFHWNGSTSDYTSRIIESASGTIKINSVTINGSTITGNLTGNCSGSSGSCTGNAATVTGTAGTSALSWNT